MYKYKCEECKKEINGELIYSGSIEVTYSRMNADNGGYIGEGKGDYQGHFCSEECLKNFHSRTLKIESENTKEYIESQEKWDRGCKEREEQELQAIEDKKLRNRFKKLFRIKR